MIVFRISREGEFAQPDWRRGRLYVKEAKHLISLLNDARSTEAEDSGTCDGHFPLGLRGDWRASPSINDTCEWLMGTIRRDLKKRGAAAWLVHLVAALLGTHEDPWLEEAVSRYLAAEPRQRTEWDVLATRLVIHQPQPSVSATQVESAISSLGTTSERLSDLWRSLTSDSELLQQITGFKVEAERNGRTEFVTRERQSLQALAQCQILPLEEINRKLRALEFFDDHFSEIQAYFEFSDRISDFALKLAMQTFQNWVNEKLESRGFTFRLSLDRLTSTYRLAPREVVASLERSESMELRLITRRSLLSAAFIAYIIRTDRSQHVQDWVEAVDLIDRLAFADVLQLVRRCRVCGRWMYVSHRRREYCGDACRYKLWAQTPKGKDKRQKASAAYRARFSEEVRQATPNVRRGQRNH